MASIVAINDTGCTTVLSINKSEISNNGCDKLIRLTATGGGTSPYTWTVDGTYYGTGTSIDITVTVASPTTQARVEQNASCGASTTFTTYFSNCSYTPQSVPVTKP